MQFEIAQIRGPNKGWQIIGQAEVDVPLVALTPDFRRLNPLGAKRWTSFFVEELPLHAVRVTFESQGSILQMRQQPFRYPNIIVDYLPLGESGLGIKNLVEIGNSQRPSAHSQFRFGAR